MYISTGIVVSILPGHQANSRRLEERKEAMKNRIQSHRRVYIQAPASIIIYQAGGQHTIKGDCV